MTKLVKIAAIPAAGFWRCGQFFPKSGAIVNKSDFEADQWERLENEPKLRITAATAEDQADVEERAEAIAEAIKTLTAQDFQRDGKPKLDALNDLLADDLGKIAAPERNDVWDQLQAEGFEAPAPDND